jgi:hypothetical protein
MGDRAPSSLLSISPRGAKCTSVSGPVSTVRCDAEKCPVLRVKRKSTSRARNDVHDPMYGPAVRCKRFRRSGDAVLHQCIRPLIGACFAPGHHGYQRACDLLSRQASIGPFGSPVFARAGKTDPPSRLILSQTSAGKAVGCSSTVRHLSQSFVRALLPFLRPGLRTQACRAPGAVKAGRHAGLASRSLAARPTP